MRLLFAIHPSGLTIKRCAEGIEKSVGRANQLLQELTAIKLVTVDKSKPEHVYRPVPDLAELITRPIESLDHVSDLSTAPDTTVDALPVPGSYAELPEDTMGYIIGL